MVNPDEKGVLLCVDDEIIVLTALKDQLRRAFGNDFHIDVAESAEEALELLDELSEQGHRLLVIVSDWLMDTSAKQHGSETGAWTAKARGFSFEEKLEVSNLVDQLAWWFGENARK